MERIVIFGCSGRGKEVGLSLNYLEYEIVGFVDNNVKIQGLRVWGGYEVKAPEKICSWDFDRVIISIPEYYESIKDQLAEYGIDESRLCIFNPITPISRVDNRIVYLRSCVERIRELNVKGACAEVGVYRGEFAKHINHLLPERKMYLYDTFEGFGEQNKHEVETLIADISAFVDTSAKIVLDKMTTPQNCIIKKGYFPQTTEDVEEQEYAFVSLDADLFQPIYDGLIYFWPRMAKGGYIFIHDYGMAVWPGVREAVNQFCQEQGVSIFPLLDMCLSAVIVK